MIAGFLRSVYKLVTHVLAPPFCLFCFQDLQERKALCQTCSLDILPVVSFDFYLGTAKIVKIFAVSAYKNPLKQLVLAKHKNNEVYIRLLADFVIQQSVIDRLDFDIIVPIPLHWTRYAFRGFNQAEIIAQALGHKTGRFVIPLLMRSKKTQFQAKLSVQGRQSNMDNAFMINPQFAHCIAGKKILLVDDLFTTGTTIKAASQLLFLHNPEKIDAFVVCRVTNS